jgi:hypothetical protein
MLKNFDMKAKRKRTINHATFEYLGNPGTPTRYNLKIFNKAIA